MKTNITGRLALIASSMMLFTGATQAANTFFNVGDLILFFQKAGSNNTVYVPLGSAANLYRGTEAGPSANLQALDIVNINSTLISAFGANWASDSGIYAGLAGARSNSGGLIVFDGDHTRTLYASRSRNGVATVGAPDSPAWDLRQANSSTAGGTDIVAMSNNLENNTSQQSEVLTTDLSSIDNLNPFLVPGIQGTAFSAFAGGVQQVGSESSFENFGDAGNVEFALDLYRITARNDSETTATEVAGVKQVGSFEGTIVVGTNGGVSFLTIPEPSSALLGGLAGLALIFRRRRNA